jgi:hypothetical protein
MRRTDQCLQLLLHAAPHILTEHALNDAEAVLLEGALDRVQVSSAAGAEAQRLRCNRRRRSRSSRIAIAIATVPTSTIGCSSSRGGALRLQMLGEPAHPALRTRVGRHRTH